MTNLVQQDPDCFICRKHYREILLSGGAIYEDDLIYVGHAQIREGQSTAYLGYLMVEPKRHIPGLAELTGREAQAIGLVVARLSRVLKSTVRAGHIYAFVLGDWVPHLHVHIVPRYPGAPREYWGVHVDEWPEAPRGAEEIDTLCVCACAKGCAASSILHRPELEHEKRRLDRFTQIRNCSGIQCIIKDSWRISSLVLEWKRGSGADRKPGLPTHLSRYRRQQAHR